MRKFTKRSAAIAAAAVIAVGGGAAAFAGGWFIDGTGEATAAGAKAENMTAKITFDKTIYPNREVKATAKVNNPNEFPVNLTSITGADGLKATRGGSSNGPCITKLAALGPNAVVPKLPVEGATKIEPKATEQPISLNLTISDKFPIECQDTLITATIKFQGTSTV